MTTWWHVTGDPMLPLLEFFESPNYEQETLLEVDHDPRPWKIKIEGVGALLRHQQLSSTIYKHQQTLSWPIYKRSCSEQCLRRRRAFEDSLKLEDEFPSLPKQLSLLCSSSLFFFPVPLCFQKISVAKEHQRHFLESRCLKSLVPATNSIFNSFLSPAVIFLFKILLAFTAL